METALEVKTAKKIKKFIECRVEVEPSTTPMHRHWDLTIEERAKADIEWYTRWAKNFEEFLKDHRSQDVNSVFVNVVTKDVCSACGWEWESPDKDEDGYFMVCCGARLESK